MQRNDAHDTDTYGDVACRLCECRHPLKMTKNGVPFIHCDRIGYGSVIFFRTDLGKQKLSEWIRGEAHVPDDTVSVQMGKTEAPQAPLVGDKGMVTASPSSIEDIVRRILDRRRGRLNL